MNELIEKLKEVRNNGSKRQVHIDLANECIKEVEALEKQLAEAREATRKAFDWALDITDEDFNSRDEVGNNYNKVKQILWEEYKEKVK